MAGIVRTSAVTRIGIVLSVLAVIACGLVTPGRADTKELKVGFIAALTGGGASWGMGMRGGVELAADEVNAAGGVKVGGTNYMIKVIAYDSKYAGPAAAQAAQRLVSQDQVKIMFEPLGSVPMLAIAGITEPAKVLVLSNSYTSKATSRRSRSCRDSWPTPWSGSARSPAWCVRNIRRRAP